MHPPRNNNLRFPYDVRSEFLVREDAFNIFLSHFLAIPSLSDGEELKFPFLFGVGEYLIMEVDIFMVYIFESKFLDKVLAILIGVGKSKCKFNPLVICFLEFVLEAEFDIIFSIVLDMIDTCT